MNNEIMNFDEMAKVEGGKNGCGWAILSAVGSTVALGVGTAATAGSALLGVGLWYSSIIGVGFACGGGIGE